jgi:RNA polymerase sigma-70 factor, ECF subfamily
LTSTTRRCTVFAWRLTGSAADAEDIVQECFLSLLRPGCTFDSGRGDVRAYLFGAIRKQALKRMRQRAAVGELPGTPTPEHECYAREVGEAVARAIRQLPEIQREAVILAHYECMPAAEIAKILGVETGAVKSRIQRGREALREALAEYAPNLEGRS